MVLAIVSIDGFTLSNEVSGERLPKETKVALYSHSLFYMWPDLQKPNIKVHTKIFSIKHYKIYKNLNLRKEVGIAIKSKETSSQLEPFRNSHV